MTACPLNCSSCTNANTCTGCITGFFLNNNQCSACDPSCHTCGAAGPNNCASCTGNLFLSGRACVTAAQCPVSTFPHIGPVNTCSGACLATSYHLTTLQFSSSCAFQLVLIIVRTATMPLAVLIARGDFTLDQLLVTVCMHHPIHQCQLSFCAYCSMRHHMHNLLIRWCPFLFIMYGRVVFEWKHVCGWRQLSSGNVRPDQS